MVNFFRNWTTSWMIYRTCQYQNIAKAQLSFSSSFGYHFGFGHFSWKRDGQPLLWFPFLASPGISLPKAIGLCNWFLLWEERELVKFHKFNIGSYGKINGGPRPDIVYCPKHGFLSHFRDCLWPQKWQFWYKITLFRQEMLFLTPKEALLVKRTIKQCTIWQNIIFKWNNMYHNGVN